MQREKSMKQQRQRLKFCNYKPGNQELSSAMNQILPYSAQKKINSAHLLDLDLVMVISLWRQKF